MKSAHSFKSRDGKKLHAIRWEPDRKPKAVVLIVHGLAEHIGRYDFFAGRLMNNGYAVVAYDQRGHGHTDPDHPGFVAEKNGFEILVRDLFDVRQQVKKEFPDLPHILFGHSMGSFVLQRHMQITDDCPAGLIYSGSNGKPTRLIHAGILLSALLNRLFGPHVQSPLLDKLTFGPYNRMFRPNRTSSDWLSRDREMVDLYEDDPLCGFTGSVSLYHQLYSGLKTLHTHKPFADHNPDIPVLILAGDRDPVSAMGAGIKNLEKLIRESGVRDLETHLYPGGRHEMIREINREEVISNLLYWIGKKPSAKNR